MASLFERLAQGRPQEPAPAAAPVPITWAAREVLDWIQNSWDEPVISTREIYRHGPAPVRWNKKRALEAAKILAKYGWLVPLKKRRCNVRQWQITIGGLDLAEDSTRARYSVRKDIRNGSSCESIGNLGK